MNFEDMPLVAFYGPSDFATAYLAAGDGQRNDKITPAACDEIYATCVALAKAEQRELLQTESELRQAIAAWAKDWNYMCEHWVFGPGCAYFTGKRKGC